MQRITSVLNREKLRHHEVCSGVGNLLGFPEPLPSYACETDKTSAKKEHGSGLWNRGRPFDNIIGTGHSPMETKRILNFPIIVTNLKPQVIIGVQFCSKIIDLPGSCS